MRFGLLRIYWTEGQIGQTYGKTCISKKITCKANLPIEDIGVAILSTQIEILNKLEFQFKLNKQIAVNTNY